MDVSAMWACQEILAAGSVQERLQIRQYRAHCHCELYLAPAQWPGLPPTREFTLTRLP
jgi:hypothetical protein